MAEEKRGGRLLNARTSSFVVAIALLIYLVLMGERAVTMIVSGEPVFVLLGVAIFVLPVLGAVLVADQLRFGANTERLARRLHDEDALPDVSHLPALPSGRVQREAADAWFESCQADVEADPDDWRTWFALAQAYDLAGDRNRGRKTMRHAIDLERRESSTGPQQA